MNEIAHANYVLIDGVLRRDAIAGLFRRSEPIEVIPLYLQTRWHGLHEAGPILVRLHGVSTLVSETYTCVARPADASLIYSDAPLPVVAKHLQRFIEPPDVLGGKGLLRFADPLVARHWLGSFGSFESSVDLDALLGPIHAWHVPDNRHAWEPATSPGWLSFVRNNPAPDWLDTFAPLGERQLSALDQAARWRFFERLYRSLAQRHPQPLARLDNTQLSRWLDDRVNEAQAWGLVSDRGLALWAEYSLRWGDGFTLHPDGPYAQWIARAPKALSLAPELRIQQMDNDHPPTETNKEL